VQIRQAPEYPFGLLSLDSLIGREYVLVSTTLSDFRYGSKRSRVNIDSGYLDDGSLMSIYLHQPEPDTLLITWIGKRFQIINFEKDTSYSGYLHIYYVQAKFVNGATLVIKVSSSELRGDGSQIVPAEILDNARKRWVGKYLWTCPESDLTDIPVFSHVKVLDIDAVLGWRGPIAFRILSQKNDTLTVHCKLQSPDTSEYHIGIGKGFGKFFLDGAPSTFWKTVPASGFDNADVYLGEDSSAFFQEMKRLKVRTQSYNVTYSMSGQDSLATAELRGKGIWGMPVDSCTATFDTGRLCGIMFMIFDSVSEVSVRSNLFKRFGSPSTVDSLGQSVKMGVVIVWMYYSPNHQLRAIALVDVGNYVDNISSYGKKLGSDFPRIPGGMLYYGDASSQSIQTGAFR
jgi:hypothetical protein